MFFKNKTHYPQLPPTTLADRERVEYLFTRYEQLTTPLLPAAITPRERGTRNTAVFGGACSQAQKTTKRRP